MNKSFRQTKPRKKQSLPRICHQGGCNGSVSQLLVKCLKDPKLKVSESHVQCEQEQGLGISQRSLFRTVVPVGSNASLSHSQLMKKLAAWISPQGEIWGELMCLLWGCTVQSHAHSFLVILGCQWAPCSLPACETHQPNYAGVPLQKKAP